MDGGLTVNLPVFDDAHGRTVCVSPFCGRLDVCPRDAHVIGPYVSAGGQDLQLSMVNLRRLIHGLFPPSSADLTTYYQRGYSDAKRFLRRENAFEAAAPIESASRSRRPVEIP